MLSSRDGQKRAAKESSGSDMWAPWMDDRTTTTYHAQYLDYFRSRKDSTPPFHPAMTLGLQPLPDEPFEAGARAQPAARAAVSSKQRTLIGRQQVQRVQLDQPIAHASTLAGVAPPRKSAERTLSQGWHMAPPSATLTAALTPPLLKLSEEDENPFEAEGAGLLLWANSVAAGTGLFLAVLLGQILVRGITEPPAAPRAEPVVSALAAAPAAPALPVESPVPQPQAAAAPPPPAAIEAPNAADSSRARSARASRARNSEPDATDPEPSRNPRARHVRDDADAQPTRSRRTRDQDAEPSPRARQSKDDAASSAPAVSSGAPGNLRINSRPWSQVTLDGQPIGHTPLFDVRVAPGTHTLRLVNPEFGLSKTVQVKVASGETVTRVELLEP